MLFVSGSALFFFGQLYRLKLGFFSTVMTTLFPFKSNKFTFSLQQIIMFAILITMLTLAHHPLQDARMKEGQKDAKKIAKAAAEAESKGKEKPEAEQEEQVTSSEKSSKKK